LNDGTGGGYCATHMPQDLKESNDEKVSNIKKIRNMANLPKITLNLWKGGSKARKMQERVDPPKIFI
jgi:hypothetical protein